MYNITSNIIRLKRRHMEGTTCARMFLLLLLCLYILSTTCSAITFNGIPMAFGDLDLNRRTDIVVVGDDGTRLDVYYQHQSQTQPPFLNQNRFSCKTDKPIVQVYLVDIDSDGNPNILPLFLSETRGPKKSYQLKNLKLKSVENSPPYATKLTTSPEYSLAWNSDNPSAGLNNSNNSQAESMALKREPPPCDFSDLVVNMLAQPLLFDLEGDLRAEFMSLDTDNNVCVWKLPKTGSSSEQFEKMPVEDWKFISKDYFNEPHSNAFIDINHDSIADIVLSSRGKIAYLYSDPIKPFKDQPLIEVDKQIDAKKYDYGLSSLVDIDADGQIDHIIPRCDKETKKCGIIVLSNNGFIDPIFSFENSSSQDTNNNYNYRLEHHEFAKNYLFPITLRASDLDGDGFTDFVVVAKDVKDSKSKILYLRNVPRETPNGVITRTFTIFEIQSNTLSSHQIHLAALFDINEDGKVDLLIGSSEQERKPDNLNITAKMNNQMIDACFMKVLVTNGFCSAEAGSDGQSARGPSICFELSQNDGRKMQGCSGQLSQSSHFALQQPYVIFGLGQTPHFVETLNVTIPGYGPDGKARTRLLEQIVPDAQVIIIPRQKDKPNSWDYKMFLSPMSDLVFSTLAALGVLCLLILFIIFILHRQETLEDAAEHEEYKRHWPESR